MTTMPIQVTKISAEFKDKRGSISRVLDQTKHKIRSILFIVRKKGSIGANHFHKKDAHYLYILSGKLKHSELNMKRKSAKVESVILKPGDLVLVPPMTGHKDEFLEDTTFFAFTTETRTQKHYEHDTIRINL